LPVIKVQTRVRAGQLERRGRSDLEGDRNLSEHLLERLLASHSSQRRCVLGITLLRLPSTEELSEIDLHHL